MRRSQSKKNRPGEAGVGKFCAMILLLSLLGPLSKT